VYCNSDEGDTVCVYSVGSERPAQVVAGAHHGQAVRDVVALHAATDGGPVLATASYDKSVAVWRSSKVV
jgi:hypothetical protein